jgi:hypothetical protein
MDEPTPATEVLKRQQRAQELAEREALTKAERGAEAKKHERRADKARYLREKLEQQAEADHSAGD